MPTIKKVLLVDDDEGILALLTAALEHAGYQPIGVESAREALKILAFDPVPVVVSDIMMPDMDGLQLLRQIKDVSPGIQVIMITAYATVDSAIEALKYGATSYLRKPFDPTELVMQVKTAFEKFDLIEENRKLIEELRYAKEYNEKVIEHLVYTVIVLDPQGTIKKINHAMESFLGFRQEEVAGKPLSFIFSDEFRKEHWQELLHEKRVKDFPVIFNGKHGKLIKATFTGTVMKDDKDNIIGFVGTTKNQELEAL